ncbi:tetratricopeptide repeat protein [Qipengyuania sp. S6317L1]|uniref:tetratricopeptide repeat protein n=1 Tax=Qipengyuania sp. S6317L1 TaxID=2926410 RepID=UPI001FF29119|nr:tetratricopeptide repeat protein [Qipengyuania sp. S6317L1]MCK0098607.1 tetratricopeptide repeat protein [Qipengyuania sp. S6317L1]
MERDTIRSWCAFYAPVLWVAAICSISVCLVVLVHSQPLIAQENPPPKSQATEATSPVPNGAAGIPDDIMLELLRSTLRQEQTQTVSEIALTNLAIAVALFGALMTVIVIFFALRTKEAAVAEASSELMRMRRDLQQLKSALREDISKELSEAVERISEVSQSGRRDDFLDRMMELVAAQHKLSPDEKFKLSMLSADIGGKDARDLSYSDFLTLQTTRLAEKRHESVRELARVMMSHDRDERIRAAGYFYQGTALHHLGHHDEACEVFEQACKLFAGSEDQDVRFQLAKVHNNLVLTYNKLKEYDKSLRVTHDGLGLLNLLPDADARGIRVKLMINKGDALSHLGKQEEARKAYHALLDLFDKGLNFPGAPETRARIEFNIACTYGLEDKVSSALKHLRYSHSIALLPDTGPDALMKDPDFKLIRAKSSFKKYVARLPSADDEPGS